jgi:hypothetical protein
MLKRTVEAHVHYSHSLAEVAALDKATVPLRDAIIAVSTGNERGQMRRILNGHDFRKRDAYNMRELLKRATRHARNNLQDFFPGMREEVLANIEELEDALDEYWKRFSQDAIEVVTTH